MTSFRVIASLPYITNSFTLMRIKAFYGGVHPRNNFRILYLIQSRYVFTEKSTKDLEFVKADRKLQVLDQLNTAPKTKNNSARLSKGSLYLPTVVNFSDLIGKIQISSLNEKSVIELLFSMSTLVNKKRFSPDFSTEVDSFIKSDEFEKFALKFEQMLPGVLPTYLCLAFQVFHLFQIPCSSILMQKLHALILDNINNFELTNIINMYLSIKKKDDELLKPLKDAFSIYFEYLSDDSLQVLANIKQMIYHAANNEVPLSIREKLVKKIFLLEPMLKDLPPDMLIKLSYLLCSPEVEFKTINRQLYIQILLQKIPTDIQHLHLRRFLLSLITGLNCKAIVYNNRLFDAIAIAATKYPLKEASDIMKMLMGIEHLNYELAEHIAKELAASDMLSLPKNLMETIIRQLGAVDYKNHTLRVYNNMWKELEAALNSYIECGVVFENIQTALSLFILELGSCEFFSKALVDFMKVENVSRTGIISAITLYQLYPAAYKKPLKDVPENFMLHCMSRIKKTSPNDWSAALYEYFNGKENVLHKCKSPFGTLLSYVVILDQDNTPLNLSAYEKARYKDSDSLEDLIDVEKIKRPPGSRVLGFMECEDVTFRNVGILKPLPRIISKFHKLLGYEILHLYGHKKKLTENQMSATLRAILLRKLNEGEL